ncbi:hypothetical protein IFVP177_C1320026 [Vibrio parahaemolyticus]
MGWRLIIFTIFRLGSLRHVHKSLYVELQKYQFTGLKPFNWYHDISYLYGLWYQNTSLSIKKRSFLMVSSAF